MPNNNSFNNSIYRKSDIQRSMTLTTTCTVNTSN